ncbi:hypothetical protein HLB35_08555 [Halomonas sp. TBZ9]|uniref:Uncharacterized protein n=1 Tax=Vreelandella azerica TaxID=2732867 RepID=A0A7Y3TYI6_9GAMM|nr:hypothetical protein [Halomonas azerica]NOG31807.1 hypothetical protein [Halomonas azerica]
MDEVRGGWWGLLLGKIILNKDFFESFLQEGEKLAKLENVICCVFYLHNVQFDCFENFMYQKVFGEHLVQLVNSCIWKAHI